MQMHAGFNHMNTFKCPCGEAFCSASARRKCRMCSTLLQAQPAGSRGFAKNLYALFCCGPCGNHWAMPDMGEGSLSACPLCSSQTTCRFVGNIHSARKWSSAHCTRRAEIQSIEEQVVDEALAATMWLCNETVRMYYVSSKLRCTTEEAARMLAARRNERVMIYSPHLACRLVHVAPERLCKVCRL